MGVALHPFGVIPLLHIAVNPITGFHSMVWGKIGRTYFSCIGFVYHIIVEVGDVPLTLDWEARRMHVQKQISWKFTVIDHMMRIANICNKIMIERIVNVQKEAWMPVYRYVCLQVPWRPPVKTPLSVPTLKEHTSRLLTNSHIHPSSLYIMRSWTALGYGVSTWFRS